jgi:hypothetical protein
VAEEVLEVLLAVASEAVAVAVSVEVLAEVDSLAEDLVEIGKKTIQIQDRECYKGSLSFLLKIK